MSTDLSFSIVKNGLIVVYSVQEWSSSSRWKKRFIEEDAQIFKIYCTIVHQFFGVHIVSRKYLKGSYHL
jgi:hypothetical protein